MLPYLISISLLAVAAVVIAVVFRKHARAAKELAASEQRYRSILAAMSNGIIFTRRDGLVMSCNPRAEEIPGMTAAEIEGSDTLNPNWRAFREDGSEFPPDSYPIMVTLRTGDPCRDVVMGFKRPDGTKRWISISTEPIFEPGDPLPVAAVASLEDVTEQRQIEEQLIRTQKMDALGKLTGGVAHDFNNLLAVILGNLELVAETAEKLTRARDMTSVRALLADGRLCKSVDEALHATGRGAELIQSLLAFSRRQRLAPEITDVNRLLGEFEPMLRRLLPETIEVRVDLASSVPMIRVDRAQLESAILNLVVNARDAMPAGGELTIGTAAETIGPGQAATEGAQVKPGPAVRLTLGDTGMGMTPEVLARAFEPFFSTKEASGGSGLGLPMVYGFVKQSGGFMQIESEPGRGSSVRLYLPAAEGEASVPTAAAAAGALPRQAHVLLVEDEEAVRTLVIAMLEGMGCSVTAAGNGPRALELLRGDQFDVLLTDVVLPGGLTGVDVAEEAGRLHPGLKILFMSGYAQGATEIPGLLRPGENMLFKPFRKAELIRLLERALRGTP